MTRHYDEIASYEGLNDIRLDFMLKTLNLIIEVELDYKVNELEAYMRSLVSNFQLEKLNEIDQKNLFIIKLDSFKGIQFFSDSLINMNFYFHSESR